MRLLSILLKAPGLEARLNSRGKANRWRSVCLVFMSMIACAIVVEGAPPPPLSSATRSQRGMVVAQSSLAAEVGATVLRDGGNAVDAAVATAFALAVTHPAAGNLGGGGFLLYRHHEGEAIAYDFREMAPSRAHPRMFEGEEGYDAGLHHRSHLAVGVPGTVAGLHLAWSDRGQLPWSRLVEPAVRLAENGFVVSVALAQSLSNALPKLRGSAAALRQFSNEGQPYQPGEILKQPDLGRTLRQVRDQGPEGFYQGEVSEKLAREMQAQGGWITATDLAAYEAKRRQPIRGFYHGFEVISMPPPSSGGMVLVEMLNILEGYEREPAPDGSGPDDQGLDAATVHRMAEAMRRGFADRARYLGDADFNPDLPVERLLSKAYASSLRETIISDRASVSEPKTFEWPKESPETTHLSVIDSARDAVALTYTLEESYGSGIIAEGTGFLLNNEMGDFNAAPGLTTTNGLIGTSANLAAPRKRMLSSMSPTIVTRDAQLFLVVGSPGGRTIINTVLQVILNMIDHRLDLASAVAAPRFHHQWLPDHLVYEPGALTAGTITLLEQWGHHLLEARSAQGAVMAIHVDGVKDRLEGVADPRAPDAAAVGW